MARPRTSIKARQEICPRREEHTLGPSGWGDWDEWATEMERTHKQVKCDGCQTYSLWVPLVPANAHRAEDVA